MYCTLPCMLPTHIYILAPYTPYIFSHPTHLRVRVAKLRIASSVGVKFFFLEMHYVGAHGVEEICVVRYDEQGVGVAR